MTEYIEREALLDALYYDDAITMGGIAIINQFPAADVWPNKTNGDMIRRMDNKNLAEWISSKFCPPGQKKKQLFRQAWLDWLNKEVRK